MMQDFFSAPDVKTLVQFLILNYASDFFVLGGAVYVYNKAREFARKRWGWGKPKDANEEAVKLLEKAVRGDEKSAKELVELITRKVEDKMSKELSPIIDGVLEDISEDLKTLREALIEQDEATHRVMESLDATINRAQNYARMWKEGGKGREEDAEAELKESPEVPEMSEAEATEDKKEKAQGKEKEGEPRIIKLLDKMWSTGRTPFS